MSETGVLGGAVTSDNPDAVGGGGAGIAGRLTRWTSAVAIGPSDVTDDGAGNLGAVISITLDDGVADLNALSTSGANQLRIAGSLGPGGISDVTVDANTQFIVRLAGAFHTSFVAGEVDLVQPLLSFRNTTVDPQLIHDASTVATAGTMSIIARDTTAAGSTGEGLTARSGNGVVADGDVFLSKGTSVSLLATSGVNLELGGALAPGARPTNITFDAAVLVDVQIANVSVFDMVRDKVDCKEPFFRSANGSIAVETLAGTRVISATDDPDTLLFDPDGADRTVTLPAEAVSDGLPYWIRNTGGANTLNVENDAAGAIVDLAFGTAALVKCDGTTWFKILEGT